MYKIIDSKNIITELGIVDSFLRELQYKLFNNFYHIYNTYLTLEYNENTLSCKVILRNVDWVRETSYQDGTARYNLFFKIKKENK